MNQPLFFIRLMVAMLVSIGWYLITGPTVYAQEEPTSTPDAAGVIYEEVRPNDSLWAVAVRGNISVNELLALNNLSQDSLIFPGQLLIIGYGTPDATLTPVVTPTATATRPPPTPTNTAAPPPRTAICLSAFDDANQNSVRNLNEQLKAGVAFTVFNEQAVIANYITDGIHEPHCIEEMVPGNYSVTRSFGPDETATTEGDWTIALTRGSVVYLEFGSYTGPALVVVTPPTADGLAVNPITTPGESSAAAVATPIAPASAPVSSSRLAATPATWLLLAALLVSGLLVIGVLFLIVRHGRSLPRQRP